MPTRKVSWSRAISYLYSTHATITVDAGEFKKEFEAAQKANATLSGGAPATTEKTEEDEEEKEEKKEEEAEEKKEEEEAK